MHKHKLTKRELCPRNRVPQLAVAVAILLAGWQILSESFGEKGQMLSITNFRRFLSRKMWKLS